MARPRKVDPKHVQALRSTGLKWKEIAQLLHVNIQTAMRSVPGPRQQAIDLAIRYGQIDGDHHKMWVIDQMVRILTGCPSYKKTGRDFNGNEYDYMALGENKAYRDAVGDGWDVGVTP